MAKPPQQQQTLNITLQWNTFAMYIANAHTSISREKDRNRGLLYDTKPMAYTMCIWLGISISRLVLQNTQRRDKWNIAFTFRLFRCAVRASQCSPYGRMKRNNNARLTLAIKWEILNLWFFLCVLGLKMVAIEIAARRWYARSHTMGGSRGAFFFAEH